MVRYFYVDESWNDEKFCLSAVSIRDSDWRNAFSMVQEHRRQLRKDKGMFIRKEIHARDLIAGRGRISDVIINKHERTQIFKGLLHLVAKLPSVWLINVCLPVRGRKEPEYDAWDRLFNRIQRTTEAAHQTEQRRRTKLLKSIPATDAFPADDPARKQIADCVMAFSPHAMVFADRGNEVELTKLYRKMTVINYIPSRYGQWPTGNTKNIPLQRIVEDPIFKESHHSFFIQLADCVAFALLKRESTPTEHVKRYNLDEAFESILTAACLKRASKHDPLGIVRR